MQYEMLPSAKCYLNLKDKTITEHTTPLQIILYLNLHLFANIVSLQRVKGWGCAAYTHHQYLKFQKWYELEICTRDTPCEMMTNNNVIDCITLLVCYLQSRHRLLIMPPKIRSYRTEATEKCAFDLKIFLWKLFSMDRF